MLLVSLLEVIGHQKEIIKIYMEKPIKNVHLNLLLDGKGDQVETANVYRARELILSKAPLLMDIIDNAKALTGTELDTYCTEQAGKIVSELKYPKEWIKTLANGFKKGTLVNMYAENLDVEHDPINNEIILRINAHTSLDDVISAWKKDVKPLQKLLKNKTHMPQKIIYKDFIFTFLKLYRKDIKYSKFIKTFLTRLSDIEELDPDKVLTDTTIKQGVTNTIKKLKL